MDDFPSQSTTNGRRNAVEFTHEQQIKLWAMVLAILSALGAVWVMV